MKKISSRALAAALLLLSQMGFALPDDTQQAIHVKANSALRNDKEGTTVYTGNVVITQGSLIITADKIVLLDQNGELQSVVATGKPATLKQTLENDGSTEASAENITYNLGQKSVELTHNAHLNQNGSLINSERIIYDVSSQFINAEGSGDGQSRVEMVIPAKAPSTQFEE